MRTTAHTCLGYTLVLMSAGFVLSCGGSSKMQPPPPQPPDVYVAGFEDASNDITPFYIAKYWKNGVPVTLGTNFSDAWSIVVSSNDVYVSGREAGPNGDVAKYWKNGVGVELTAGGQNMASIATSIFVDGNDVYVAGLDHGMAKYWKNGVEVDLTDGKEYGEAWSITVSHGDVYVAGWQYKTTQIDPTHTYTAPVAKYWKNGVATELSDPLAFGIAHSIFLSGNDVYVAGNTCQENEPVGCDLVTYWKNGTPVVLPGQKPSGGTSIFVSGADVYVAGNYIAGAGDDDFADLWKNGTMTQLSTRNSAANQIVVSGNDIFVAGANINAQGQEVAGYWKNGVFAALTDGTHFASGFSVTVVQH